jgi:hypothetical protein
VISVNDDYALTVSVTAVVVSTGAGASSTLVFFWQLTVTSAKLATIKITSNFFILLSFTIILKNPVYPDKCASILILLWEKTKKNYLIY